MDIFLADPYGPFILGSYAASFVGIVAMIAWVWLGYRTRLRQLAALEKAGFGRNKNRQKPAR